MTFYNHMFYLCVSKIRLFNSGFADKDIYVCECRYSTKLRAFKKIKIWPCQNDAITIVARETPLEPRRVMSIFKERVEKHKGELAELQLQEKLVEKEKPVHTCYFT